jgi:nitroreductase
MTVFESIQKRQSVRAYQDRDVEDASLERILEAARLAPSARNRQEWRFVVVRDPARRAALSRAAKGQQHVAQAPVVIAGCAETDGAVMTCGQQCYPIDLGIAIEHIALQAVEEGLGTCWIGAFEEDAAKAVLGIPPGAPVRVVELITLGHPADEQREKTRLAMDEIVMWEQWGR